MATFSLEHNVAKLEAALSEFSGATRSLIISRGMNDGARYGMSEMRRRLKDAGGWKPRYISEKTKTIKSTSGTLEVRLNGRDRYSLVNNFSPSPATPKIGGVLRSASPWNERRQYKNVFYVRSKYSTDRAVPVVRVGGRLKGVYGPSIAREMERPETFNPVRDKLGEKIPERMIHYAEYEASRLKGRYGL